MVVQLGGVEVQGELVLGGVPQEGHLLLHHLGSGGRGHHLPPTPHGSRHLHSWAPQARRRCRWISWAPSRTLVPVCGTRLRVHSPRTLLLQILILHSTVLPNTKV